MTLVYLVAAPDPYKKNSMCIRTEIMTNREPAIVLYRNYRTGSYKQAKMMALIDILSRFKFPSKAGITIFTDDSEIEWEWKEICDSKDFWAIREDKWDELLPLLSKFAIKPQIKDKGCLTTAMRSDMKLYMQQGGRN